MPDTRLFIKLTTLWIDNIMRDLITPFNRASLETLEQVYDERFAKQYGFPGYISDRLYNVILNHDDLYNGFFCVGC